MSMNKYMHPRNIYRSPPNFQQLALNFPAFREFVKQDITGKATLDFKDIKALRALSCTLLKKDFDLDVDIPLTKLIPTIPLRLNYVLWLEDLLSLSCPGPSVKGIDIGTGASCIYPLIAAKKNGWKILATEVDNDSIVCARNNVSTNCLQDLITVIKVTDNMLLKEALNDEQYDFCMCNPPFFSSTQELNPYYSSRKSTRPRPKNSFCATVNEVVVEGGEVDFISKLIQESKELGAKVNIYTTMIGHKKNLPQLKKLLRDVEVCSFKEMEFCQGNTTRWGLAWTYNEAVDLKKCPDPSKEIARKVKPKEPLIHLLNLQEIDEYTLNLVSKRLLKLFVDLQMSVEEVSRKKTCLRYFTTAFSNTWSNQRRKRREKLRSRESCNSNSSSELSNGDIVDSNMKSPGKRNHEDDLDGVLIKKLKINGEEGPIFFKFVVSVRNESDKLFLELDCGEEYDKNYLYQILQYIKNNLKVDS